MLVVKKTVSRHSFDRPTVEEEAMFFIGEPVSYPDGIFVTGNREYAIKNGVVAEIWNVPDENQLCLF